MSLKSDTNERIVWLDMLKGIGIILVVFGHIYSNKTVFNYLYSFHIPLFFFAAGYVYKKRNFKTDLKRRFRTILVPYYFFGALELIYFIFFESKFRKLSIPIYKSIFGLLFGEYKLMYFNVHLWFLPCFFSVVIIFNIINRYLKNKYLLLIIILLSAIFVLNDTINYDFPQLPYEINRVPKYIFFYYFGYKFKEKKVISNKFENKSIITIILFLIFALASWIMRLFIDNNGIYWFVIAIMGIMMCIMFVQVIIAIRLMKRLLFYCGYISIVVLCIHGPIYRIIIFLFSKCISCSAYYIRDNFWISCMVTAITIVICSITYNIIKKSVPWVIGKEHKREKI